MDEKEGRANATANRVLVVGGGRVGAYLARAVEVAGIVIIVVIVIVVGRAGCERVRRRSSRSVFGAGVNRFDTFRDRIYN